MYSKNGWLDAARLPTNLKESSFCAHSMPSCESESEACKYKKVSSFLNLLKQISQEWNQMKCPFPSSFKITFGHQPCSGCCWGQSSTGQRLWAPSGRSQGWCWAAAAHRLCFLIDWIPGMQQMISEAHPSTLNCKEPVIKGRRHNYAWLQI